MNQLLTVQDVARILAVKVDRVYEMAAAGQIPVIRVRRVLRFDPDAIKAWMAAGGTTGSPTDKAPVRRAAR